MRWHMLGLMLLMAVVCPAALADDVQLNLSSAFNMDAWTGPKEIQVCYTDGSHDLTELFGGQTAGNGWYVFSQSRMMIVDSTSTGFGQTYSISGQWFHPYYISGTEGTPENGVLTGAASTYHIASALGNSTLSGDWTEVANPSSHTLKPNCVVAGAQYDKSAWQISSVTVELPAAQKGAYESVNFVLAAMNMSDKARNMRIVALYGSGGAEEVVLYAFSTASGGSGPRMTDATGGNDFVAVYTMSKFYDVAAGATGTVDSATSRLWEFASPLSLDGTKTLWGFKIQDTDASLNWASRGLAVFAATATPAAVASGDTWHVDAVNGDDDTGDGSSGDPYQTIGAVWSQLEGGDTVILYDGDYGVLEKYTTWNADPDDLFTDWVTFRAATGAEPVLEHVWIGTGTAGAAADPDSGRHGTYDAYLKFEGLTIENGVIFRNARYWTLKDCLITLTGACTGSSAAIDRTAVLIDAGDHVTIEGCEVTNMACGISGAGVDINILGNHIHHGTNDGLRPNGFWDSLVEGNVIHDFDDGVTDAEQPVWSRHCNPIHIFVPGPGYAGWQNHNVVFRNNVIYDAEAEGVQFNNYFETCDTVRNEEITFENNVFGPSQAVMFSNAERCDGLIFRNNTVCKLDAPRSFGRWTLNNTNLLIGTSTGVEVYNNILGSVGFVEGAQVDLFDWNLIQTPGTPRGVDDSRAYGRFTIIGGDADLVDADDFDGLLGSGSDAINTGTELFAPGEIYEYDIDGTPRDNRPDMGAWEYPDQTPSAESAAPVYNDSKTIFVDDFEDGHYNDVDPWLQAANTQGLSWFRPAGYDAFKYYVTSFTGILDRNSMVMPVGEDNQNRVAWLLSNQGDNWADYTFEFDCVNAWLETGAGVVVLAKDAANCYYLDITSSGGRLIRIMGGTATTLATDSDIRMPGEGERAYAVTVSHGTSGITIAVDVGRNSSVEMSYTDTNATARSTFTAGGVGFHCDNNDKWHTLRFDNIRVEVDEFED